MQRSEGVLMRWLQRLCRLLPAARTLFAFGVACCAMLQDKEYSGTIRLGEATASYDAETEVKERLPWQHITGGGALWC